MRHLALERDPCARDAEAHAQLQGWGLKGQTAQLGRDRRPIVQPPPSRPGAGPPQEVGLRAVGVGRHGDEERPRRDRAGRHRSRGRTRALDGPPGWRHELDVLDPGDRVTGVPDRRVDLEALAADHDPVVGHAIDREPRRVGERPLEGRTPVGVTTLPFLTERGEGPGEEGGDGLRMQGVERGPGGVDQGHVAPPAAQHGVHPCKEVPVRGLCRPAPLPQGEPDGARARLL